MNIDGPLAIMYSMLADDDDVDVDVVMCCGRSCT
jgi:hypothetical protein